MSKRLAPYGNENYIGSVAAVGGQKVKGARRLAGRLPSSDLLSKVGLPDVDAATALRLVRLKAR